VVDAATGKPADGRTVFRAASLTKPVFAYLVMKLVDEGVLDLDTPVHRYLKNPLDTYPAYASFRGEPRYEQLTARLLLSHQGGLPNWRRVRPDGPIQFHSDPGDHFAYSGEGYALLQFVIETVTGQDLATLARDKVFVPLGMNDTSFLWESRFDGRFAVELRSGIGRFIADTRRKGNAAASIITNASDYARFLGAVLNGAGLTAATRAVMLEPQVALTSRSLFSAPGTDAGINRAHKMAWTPGWGTFEDANGRALFHVGREEGCENFAEAFLDRRLGVVILSLTTSAESFSAPLVDYTIGGVFSPLEWLEYRQPLPVVSPWRGLLLGLATLAALLVAFTGLRRLLSLASRRKCHTERASDSGTGRNAGS
jgi:CubicO group peptidase (beta-lactamase class C family)